MSKLEEFKSAAELALEEAPDLHMFIYCYKDKAVDRYNPIFVDKDEPKFMVDGVKNAVIKSKGQELAKLTGLQLCFCGTFELKTGKFEVEEPAVLVDCDLLIEKYGGVEHGKVA